MKDTTAQDISVKNPSLEGTGQVAAAPPSWILCGDSPDILPMSDGHCGVTQRASEGKTFVGLYKGANDEGISQQLTTPLVAGKTYTFSIDLASPSYYCISICYSDLAIYGSNTPCGKDELLWESGTFTHQTWWKYAVTFSPTRSYTYISFYAMAPNKCSQSKFSAILVDNVSTLIKEVPQIVVMTKAACKGTENGSATVKVMRGEGPYNYSWSPGNYNTQTVNNLRSGKYIVTVTGKNGTSVKDSVLVGEYEMKGTAVISGIDCYGRENGRIRLSAEGGVSPYIYSLNNGRSYDTVNVFGGLKAGYYHAAIKDSNGCDLEMKNLEIMEPDELTLTGAKTRAVACSSVQNGEIGIAVTGGTRPYNYALFGEAWQTDSILGGLDAGVYHYRVADSHDCMVEGDAEITKEWRDCGVWLPTAFSPNGDGKNDIFRAVVHDAVKDFNMAVYGRWGELIFRTTNPDLGWDGIYRGNQVPAGSYIFVVTYTDSKGQAMKQTGSLVVLR